MSTPAQRHVQRCQRPAEARRLRSSRGSITPFALIVSIALLALGGLVIDGGRVLNSKGRALAYAEEAARAGAQMIDPTEERAVLDPELAVRAAADYCATATQADSELVNCAPTIVRSEDATGNVVYQVVVATTIRTNTILRSLFGTQTQEASAQARAAPYQGIIAADTGQLKQYDPSLLEPNPNDSGIDQGGYEDPGPIGLATCAIGQVSTPEQPCIPTPPCSQGQAPTVAAPCIPPCSPSVGPPCVPPCPDAVNPTDPLQCFVPPECRKDQVSTPGDPCRPPPPDPGNPGDPGPGDPSPGDPGPGDPSPSDPAPSEPGPSDPGPVDPGPSPGGGGPSAGDNPTGGTR